MPMSHKTVFLVSPHISNRLRPILLHVPYYTIEGAARLAYDAGLSRSTVSRLIRGKISPSYQVISRITKAISERYEQSLDPREIFTTNDTYPTASVCQLMNCKGCLPPEAWDERTDTLKPNWRNQKPGEWSRLQASPILPGTLSLPKLAK